MQKTFRLFVSSTFSDFIEERRLLQTVVFPKIKEKCKEHNLTFQPIDLRWGVTDEASNDQKTLEICLEEVQSSKLTPYPNFLIMAGDRYGTVILPYAIEQKEFETLRDLVDNESDKKLLNTWYILDENQIPESYILQSRKGDNKDNPSHDGIDYTYRPNWKPINDTLLETLQKAAEKSNLSDDKKKKYKQSATEAEVIEGIFGYLDQTPKQKEKYEGNPDLEKHLEKLDYENVYAYIRNIQSMDDFGLLDKFVDCDMKNVDNFKNELKKSINKNENIFESNINLTNISKNENGSLKYFYEELSNTQINFVSELIKFLEKSINKYIEELKNHEDEDLEKFEQERFKESKLKDFLEGSRKTALNTIDKYISNDDNQALVIYGPSGMGKSSLIAKAIQDSKSKFKNTNTKVIYRFAGSTANLANSPQILISILKELGINEEIRKVKNEQTGQEEPEKIEEFYYRIHDHFKNLKTNTVIFLDAIDQINNEDEFLWLPKKLPSNVKIIISALEDKKYEEDSKYFIDLKTKTNNLYKLEEFQEDQAEQLIINILKRYDREIQPNQMNYLLDIYKEIKTPLYLSVAAQELRHWKSTDKTILEDKENGQDLASTQKGMIEEFISNLSEFYHHDKEFVKRVFSYLYLSEGLSEPELLEVINTDKEFISYIAPDKHHVKENKELPIVIWARLHSQIKEFIKLEEKDGQETMSFFHREFNDVIKSEENIDVINNKFLDYIYQLIKLYQNQSFDSNRWGKIYSDLLINQIVFCEEKDNSYDTIGYILYRHDLIYINVKWLKCYLDYNRNIDFFVNKNNTLWYLQINKFITFYNYINDPNEWAFEYYDNLTDFGYFYKIEKVPGIELSDENKENNQTAIDCFKDAIDVAKFIKEKFNDYSRYKRTLLSLASRIEDKNIAIKLEKEALEINDGIIYNDLTSKLNYAISLRQNGQTNEALQLLNSIELGNIINAKFEESIRYEYLYGIENLYGNIYYSQDKYNSAINHYSKALEYADKLIVLNNKKYCLKLIAVLTHLSQAYLESNDLEEASLNIERVMYLINEYNLAEDHSYYKKASFLKIEIDIKKVNKSRKQDKLNNLLDLAESWEKEQNNISKLLEAIKSDDIESLSKILNEDNLDLNYIINEEMEDPSEWETPLSIAVKNGNLEITELLIKNGANIETVDLEPNGTVLFFAIFNNDIEMIKLLFKYNANIYQEGPCWGYNPYNYAIENQLNKIIEIFKDYDEIPF